MMTTNETQKAEGQSLIGPPDLQRLVASLLEAFPDRASAAWRDRDSAAADTDGWNIFNAGEPDAQLERDDAASIFLEDGSVWLQVRSRALAGVPLAIRALAHLLHWNAGELQRVISFASDAPTEPSGNAGRLAGHRHFLQADSGSPNESQRNGQRGNAISPQLKDQRTYPGHAAKSQLDPLQTSGMAQATHR